MTTPKQLLTDEEYKQVIIMAVAAKPQTEKQIMSIIETAEKMRAESLILESVLTGQLCMYDEDGQTMFCRPNSYSPEQLSGEQSKTRKP